MLFKVKHVEKPADTKATRFSDIGSARGRPALLQAGRVVSFNAVKRETKTPQHTRTYADIIMTK